MKRTLLLIFTSWLLFIAAINYASAQQYKPTAVSGAHWIVIMTYEVSPNPVDGGIWEYYCNGDTLINEIEYKIIYRRDLEITQSGPPFTPISDYELMGFMRDDTIARKVYGIDWLTTYPDECPEGEEYLMFDFSLSVGDTTDICLFAFEQEEIMAIWYGEAFFQMVNIFITPSSSLYEGIGSQYGLFEAMISISGYSTYLYYYCPGSPCEYLVSTQNIVTPEYFKLYPNPSSSTLTIDFDAGNKWQKVVVYNSMGIAVDEHALSPGASSHVLHTNNYSPGIYFCGLVNQNTRTTLAKFIR